MADTPRIVRGHKAAAPHSYVAPPVEALFPDVRRYLGGYPHLRAYVSERLVEMAANGGIIVTDLMNMPATLRDVCGDVILGNTKAPDNTPTKAIPPIELQMCEIKLRSCTEDTISWKVDRENIADALTPQSEAAAGRFSSGGYTDPSMTMVAVKKKQDVYAETDKREATLNLADAWKVLRQHGQYCVYAPSPTRRARKWKYVEVAVEERIAAAEAKRGPGRPRKN